MVNINKKKALGVGLGLAAAASALGAGYYFYGSKHAAGNRKKAARWANDFKAEVVKKAKKVKKLDERAFHAVVDEAMKAYGTVRSIDKADLRSLAAELKTNWKNVEREINRVAKSEKKVVGRAAKRAVKSVKRVIPRVVANKASGKKKQ
ncbi:MAG: hypothetical protein A2942_02610 [Candidatus Lloydbacteria bacterium RIFCSPLOWO2_01_FULL_50_20]|uniref:Uncharacterized protein n=1 Tax=Candidatus Lloydbacteria bacterium RIFCSPLOWO2_01_FULL_50_20 TaxID=1798665 RepID=A0A1G2DEV3_9BACT|nr:MAG: hypothetical protein A3C13_01960 [Candidatus Lloydbacteria bacterium RIFCSPHIGHO2_02_FULL_50_11]OGZ12139.1 MAG: hypothetical protein A2942_02610 [Candidatus Lloydbacteria bacterium RIFCSPLOWO2_01_FULL_50_20]